MKRLIPFETWQHDQVRNPGMLDPDKVQSVSCEGVYVTVRMDCGSAHHRVVASGHLIEPQGDELNELFRQTMRDLEPRPEMTCVEHGWANCWDCYQLTLRATLEEAEINEGNERRRIVYEQEKANAKETETQT